MIKFFRRVRQRLLTQNQPDLQAGKFSKYLLYAIGEIILVVIGILIALQINNWNEERKSANNTKLLFEKTLEELKFNIEKANDRVSRFRYQNYVYHRIINKKATRDNYKLHGYAYLLMSGKVVELSDDTFQKLLNSEEKLTQEQDALLSKLKRVYSNDKAEVDFLDTKLPEVIFDLHKKYKDEQPWYSDFISYDSISEAMIDYCLSDPEYVNDASYYYTIFPAQQNNSLKKFRNNALITYTELTSYLNIPPDSAIVKNLTHYKHYLGTYKSDDYTLHIKEEANHFMHTIIRNKDSTMFQKGQVYLDSKSYFTVNRYFGNLIYDKDHNVKEVVFYRGGQKITFQK